MEQQEAARKIEGLVKKLADIMGFQVEISIGEPSLPFQGAFVCRIGVKESSHLLIGTHGANLEALQHIVQHIARRKLGVDVPFVIDINHYWDDKRRLIVSEAREAALQADRDRRAVILRPMSGFKRKIIHTELVDDPRVTTESIGTGGNRKVVIKPASIFEE